MAVELGCYAEILELTAVRNLVQSLAFSMQARAADEGRSFFSMPGGGTKIGTKVMHEPVTPVGTFLVENGEISRAVKNLRFNESPVFMLNNVEKLGKVERVRASESGGMGSAIEVPPTKVRDFNFTSLSDAI